MLSKNHMRWVSLCLCCALLLTSQIVQAKPQRIISLNVCTDQLLMLLVGPERLVGITKFAANPDMSAMTREANSFPALSGTAENVLSHSPDLVISGTFSARTTIRLLNSLGYKTLSLSPETNLNQISKNIKRLGEAVGEKAKAQKIITRLDMRKKAILKKVQVASKRPLAAIYYANHYAAGKNTLIDQLATAAGFETIGSRLDFSGMRKLSLEKLLSLKPDVLILGQRGEQANALANEVFRHPALQKLAWKSKRLYLPHALTDCGTPKTLEALKRLVHLRNQWVGNMRAKNEGGR